jgi:hypothetical protein
MLGLEYAVLAEADAVGFDDLADPGLMRRRTMRPDGSRAWPSTLSTLNPPGKRGVTVSARNAAHSASLTSPPACLSRPK